MTFISYAEPGTLAQSNKRARTRGTTSMDSASYAMLQLYRTNLEVRLQCMEDETLSDHQRRISSRVGEMLQALGRAKPTDGGLEWDEVYQAERLSSALFNGAQLRQEIVGRLAELVEQKAPEAPRLRHEYEALTRGGRDGHVPDDGVLRAFLVRLIEAVQWTAKKRYLVKPICKEATKKALMGVLVAFLCLIVPYVAMGFDYKSESELVSPLWSHFALYTAVFSGALGAFFSRLIALQRDWPHMGLDEASLHNDGSYVLLRAGVGMCGALILFYFFHSELISGSIFPQVSGVGLRLLAVEPPAAIHMAFTAPTKDLALLTVWCFLGGFSEALVPGLLAKTEHQLAQTNGTAKGH